MNRPPANWTPRPVARPWLLPLVPLYRVGQIVLDARKTKAAEKLEWPVISVGNLSTGGAGKTPFTIALAELLARHGYQVDILSRGYGRRSTGVERVPGTEAISEEISAGSDRFGDEPLLIARQTHLPVYVGKSRFEAGRLAEKELRKNDPAAGGAPNRNPVHLLDDGFQHRQLTRTVDIVLLNSEDLAGTLLPAGNLREPLFALQRASVFAIAEEDDRAAALLQSPEFGDLTERPVWRFGRRMLVPDNVKAAPVLAFCGIARPEQFFRGLEEAGVTIAARRTFGDHHRFSVSDLKALGQQAHRAGAAAMVTTTKDRVRLDELACDWKDLPPIHAINLKLLLRDEEAIALWLKDRLG